MKKILLLILLVIDALSYANAQEFSDFFTLEYEGQTYQNGNTIVVTNATQNIDDNSLVDYTPNIKILNNSNKPRMISLNYQYCDYPSKAEAESDWSWGFPSLCYSGAYVTDITPESACLISGSNSIGIGFAGVPAKGTDTFLIEPRHTEVDPAKDSFYKLVLVAMEGMPEYGNGLDNLYVTSDQEVIYFRFCSKKTVSYITLDKNNETLNEGQSTQLNAEVSPLLPKNTTLIWTSSNEAVATVDQYGLVTAISQGTAVITVYSSDDTDISATCDIIVIHNITKINLSETEVLMDPGQYRILTADIISDNVTTPDLIWTSSNEEVARVVNGVVIAVANGEAIITATANDGSGASASCNVIVRTLVTEIILSQNHISIKEGEYAEITTQIIPNNATNSDVIWSSSDTSVITVLNGLVLAHKQGTALIHVEAVDGSGVYAECAVEVSTDTGINDISDDDISISIEHHIVTIYGIGNDTTIRLYDTSGNMIYSGNDSHIEVAQSGVYIIVVNDKPYKILL